MRNSAIVFALLLAMASVTTNAAYAKGRHHHHHHHHHHNVPSTAEMNHYARVAFLSLFAPLPITMWATSRADHAAAKVMRHARHHRH